MVTYVADNKHTYCNALANVVRLDSAIFNSAAIATIVLATDDV